MVRKGVITVVEKLSQYKKRIDSLIEDEKLSPEVQALLTEMMTDLTEVARSNKALRRAAVKSAQSSMMSSRLRDALQE
ncbi:hypothetical protein [Paenibacillus wynnii]|uniref:Uncharacterized protein n=1 Tax=Paenibacillus wynnii TaxID=268407 RepID=A0A098M8T8_9BACL|nr:hypothetical protein [Paenibacillus wynnii]KGE17942.1 hypothetical protein PWYN_25695 [Paenibacillus wynnii]